MDTAWADDGQASSSQPSAESSTSATASNNDRPRRRRSRIKPSKPFVSADYKPDEFDGIYRVIIITSGSVASVKLPLIVGELAKVCETRLGNEMWLT
jgi:phosphopantothenoylcysteine decarboxylase